MTKATIHFPMIGNAAGQFSDDRKTDMFLNLRVCAMAFCVVYCPYESFTHNIRQLQRRIRLPDHQPGHAPSVR